MQPLWLPALADHPEAFGPSYDEQAVLTLEQFGEILAESPNRYFLGAFVDDTLAGFVGVFLDPREKLTHSAALGRLPYIINAHHLNTHESCCDIMPVENSWIVEERIMLTRLIGHITIEEMTASAQKGTIMIESGVAPVYSLVDASQIEKFPLKLNEMKALTDQGSSDKLGWIIIYGIPNRFLAFLATTFVQVIGKNYKVVSTLEEAMTFIRSREGDLIGGA